MQNRKPLHRFYEYVKNSKVEGRVWRTQELFSWMVFDNDNAGVLEIAYMIFDDPTVQSLGNIRTHIPFKKGDQPRNREGGPYPQTCRVLGQPCTCTGSFLEFSASVEPILKHEKNIYKISEEGHRKIFEIAEKFYHQWIEDEQHDHSAGS